MAALDKSKLAYSEQDTADKLILPYLTSTYKFPSPDSLDYQAQHSIELEAGKSGRYDGLYLSGGYPYVVLEAKKYAHDLEEEDIAQARDYATSSFFDKAVPLLLVSNGRDHRFLKITGTIDPADGKLSYLPIPPTDWSKIRFAEAACCDGCNEDHKSCGRT
jgi:Type I restriction enzyme R protein N terminus (HSDR_N)